jgi:GTPase SAR1 family protein
MDDTNLPSGSSSTTYKDQSSFEKDKKKRKKKSKVKSSRSRKLPKHVTDASSQRQSQKLSNYQNPHVALQMWDTAGKERLLNDSAGLTSRLGDSFFRHANAAILIYDVTSSRSFLQLIKWHKELLERLARIHESSTEGKISVQQSNFPIVVVGTKLDRLEAKQSISGNITTVPQRNVLGLKNGFKGMDYHYEYGYIHGTDLQNQRSSNHKDIFNKSNDSDLRSTSNGQKREALKYGLEGGSWTSDTSYMAYLRLAEDECFPDRSMVKRWCRKNGLVHIEVSALKNIRVDTAVETAVSLALKAMENEGQLNDYIVPVHSFKEGAHENLRAHAPQSDTSKNPSSQKCNFCNFLLQLVPTKKVSRWRG